jgi:hypothetical protein
VEVASLADDAVTSSDANSADIGDPLLAFATCMRENGLDDYTDPILGPGGTVEFPDKSGSGTKDAYSAVFDVCGRLLESTVFGATKTDADGVGRLVEFDQCMREAGFDMPDPDATGQFEELEKDEKKSAEFAAAYEQCADELGTSSGSK